MTSPIDPAALDAAVAVLLSPARLRPEMVGRVGLADEVAGHLQAMVDAFHNAEAARAAAPRAAELLALLEAERRHGLRMARIDELTALAAALLVPGAPPPGAAGHEDAVADVRARRVVDAARAGAAIETVRSKCRGRGKVSSKIFRSPRWRLRDDAVSLAERFWAEPARAARAELIAAVFTLAGVDVKDLRRYAA